MERFTFFGSHIFAPRAALFGEEKVMCKEEEIGRRRIKRKKEREKERKKGTNVDEYLFIFIFFFRLMVLCCNTDSLVMTGNTLSAIVMWEIKEAGRL